MPRLKLFAPSGLVRLDRSSSGVVAELVDGTRLTARLAVAADGRNSALRRAAGIRTMGWSYPQTGIVCTVAHERPIGALPTNDSCPPDHSQSYPCAATARR